MYLFVNEKCQQCYECEQYFHQMPMLARKGINLSQWVERDDEVIGNILEMKKNCKRCAIELLTEIEFKKRTKE